MYTHAHTHTHQRSDQKPYPIPSPSSSLSAGLVDAIALEGSPPLPPPPPPPHPHLQPPSSSSRASKRCAQRSRGLPAPIALRQDAPWVPEALSLTPTRSRLTPICICRARRPTRRRSKRPPATALSSTRRTSLPRPPRCPRLPCFPRRTCPDLRASTPLPPPRTPGGQGHGARAEGERLGPAGQGDWHCQQRPPLCLGQAQARRRKLHGSRLPLCCRCRPATASACSGTLALTCGRPALLSR